MGGRSELDEREPASSTDAKELFPRPSPSRSTHSTGTLAVLTDRPAPLGYPHPRATRTPNGSPRASDLDLDPTRLTRSGLTLRVDGQAG